MYTISAKQLGYKHKTVLQDINIELESSRIYGMIGQNGAGKTTLLNNIMGFIKGNEIQISQDDEILSRGDIINKISFSIDEDINGNYTVKKYLTLVSSLYEVPYPFDYINLLGLNLFENEIIKRLSFGNKRKVLLTLCLLRDASIYIFDEPLIGLDPVGINNLKKILEQLKGQGKTIIFSNHQLREMEQFCDGYFMVDSGRVIKSNLAQQSYLFSDQKQKEAMKKQVKDDNWGGHNE